MKFNSKITSNCIPLATEDSRIIIVMRVYDNAVWMGLLHESDRIFETFNRHGVNYLLIGGMNMLLRHGGNLTYDVDCGSKYRGKSTALPSSLG